MASIEAEKLAVLGLLDGSHVDVLARTFQFQISFVCSLKRNRFAVRPYALLPILTQPSSTNMFTVRVNSQAKEHGDLSEVWHDTTV